MRTKNLSLSDIRNNFNFFSPQLIKSYNSSNKIRLAFDLSVIILQIIFALLLFIKYPSVLTYIFSFFLIGGSQHGFGLVSHEGAHKLLVKNKQINDLISYFFSGAIFLPFNTYRERHLIHHRELSTANDTKYFYKKDYGGINFLIEIFKTLLCYDFIIKALNVLLFNFSNSSVKNKIKFNSFNFFKDIFAILLINLLIFSLFTIFTSAYHYLFFWLIPLMTSSVLFSKLRSLVEHQPYKKNSNELKNNNISFIPFMRSVNASFVEKIFFSKFNFHFHSEHHLWPAVSYQHLPKLHQELMKNHSFNKSLIFYDHSYISSLIKIFNKT